MKYGRIAHLTTETESVYCSSLLCFASLKQSTYSKIIHIVISFSAYLGWENA